MNKKEYRYLDPRIYLIKMKMKTILLYDFNVTTKDSNRLDLYMEDYYKLEY